MVCVGSVGTGMPHERRERGREMERSAREVVTVSTTVR